MALTDLTRISTAGIATGTSLSGAILHGDAHFRGNQVGVNSAIFDSSERELNFKDNVELTFGDRTNGDLKIYHNGSDNYIDAITGSLYFRNTLPTNTIFQTGNFLIKNQSNNQNVANFAPGANGGGKIYHENILRFNTTSTGAVVSGILTATSFSGPLVGNTNNTSGLSTFYDLRVSNNLTVEGTTTTLDTNLIGVDRVEILTDSNTLAGIAVTQAGTADLVRLFDGATRVVTIDGDGRVGLAQTNPLEALHLGDNQKIALGWGQDLEIFFNGTNSVINNTEGALLFQNNGSSSMYIGNTGQVYLNNDITFVGASANALWDKSENYFSIPDSIVHSGDTDTKIRFPSADTIQFETGGSNKLSIGSSITSTTAITIYNADPELTFRDSNHSPYYYSFKAVGGAFNLSDSVNGDRIRFSANGSTSVVAPTFVMTGAAQVSTNLGVTGSIIISDQIYHNGDTDTRIRFPAADTFTVETGGNERFSIASDGQNTIKSGAHDKGLDILPVGNQQETRLRIQAKNSSGTEHTFSFNAKQSANRLDISGTGPICFIGSQNVGVQNSIPTSPLHVGDDVNPHSTKALLFVGPASGDGQFHLRGGSPTVFFDSTSSGNAKILTDNTALTISNGTLDSNGTELLRITSGGSVLIDTTVTTEVSGDFDDLVIGSTSDTNKGISIVGSTTGGVGSLTFTDGASYKNQGIIQYRHADDSMRFTVAQYERLRIDSNGRTLLNNLGNTTPGLSTNADDLVIGYGTQSGETGITMFSTTASGIRFNDNSGTDAAIEYSHSARELRFNSAGANRLQFGVNASNSPVFSLGSGHYSGDGNNHNQGDRASVKVGAYLHLESGLGGGHNAKAGLGYNCYFSSNENFNCGTKSPSGGDNRPAAYGMGYGNHYFYCDASNTAHSAQAQLTMSRVMEILRDGDVKITDGDLVIGTSGHGIDFSATANGGSGTPSELLDDYEEGYFAPTIRNLSSGYASGTFYNRQARYTKVGNMVTCWVHLQWWANATTTDNSGNAGGDNLELTIEGFPFEVDGVGYSGGCGGGLQAQSWRFSGSGFNNYAVGSDNVQPRINSNEEIRFGVFKHNSITGQVTQKSINGYSPNIEFCFTVRVTSYK